MIQIGEVFLSYNIMANGYAVKEYLLVVDLFEVAVRSELEYDTCIVVKVFRVYENGMSHVDHELRYLSDMYINQTTTRVTDPTVCKFVKLNFV